MNHRFKQATLNFKIEYMTNYRKAWLEFRKSKEYASCWESMKNIGFKQRYANNVLQSAFAAGWGDKKIFIIN